MASGSDTSMEVGNGSAKSQSYRNGQPSPPQVSTTNIHHSEHLVTGPQTISPTSNYDTPNGNSTRTEKYEFSNNCLIDGYPQTANSFPAFLAPINPEHTSNSGIQQRYYSLVPTAIQEPIYASEIIIEGEQNETTISDSEPQLENQPQPNGVASGGHYAQHSVSATEQSASFSMRRWSRENAPEERLRIGLPRYESEQQRIAYEESNVHDHRITEGDHRRQPRRRRHEHRRR